jgi:hypothetical protein
VKLNLLTGAKVTIIEWYLPQPVEEHTHICEALSRLSTSLPYYLLIVEEDLQEGWDGTSQKDLNIAYLAYARWAGTTTPTYTPR